MRVQEQCVVSLRYCMLNSKGEVLENLMNGPPITYLHGEGKILSGLEAQLTGLAAGENKHICISSVDYVGLDDDLQLEVIIDDIRVATTEELINGTSQPINELTCGDDCACYNKTTNDELKKGVKQE